MDPFSRMIKNKNDQVALFKKKAGPHVNVQHVRPDGIAASNHKTRQLLVNPNPHFKTTEAKVKFIDSRPVILSDSFAVKALYDLGATSCSIKQSVLDRMEAISPLPRIPYSYKIAGFIPDASQMRSEIAYVSLKKPVLINENKKKALFGNKTFDQHFGANSKKHFAYIL